MTLADLPREGESIYDDPRALPDYKIDAETDCWVWQKATTRGYATHGDGSGKPHRRYYERAYGSIPEGFHVHHRCENTACVNPAHLAAISERDHHLLHFMQARGYSLDLIREVRAEGRKPGASYREVAKRYGMHFNTVYRWWIAESWADLFEDGPVVMATKVCPHCGEDFNHGRRDRRYCTPKCQQQAKGKRQTQRRREAS